MIILEQKTENVNNFKEDFIMGYIYKMSKEMYEEVIKEAKYSKMSVEEYVTATFGLVGKCVKVDTM